MLRFSPSIDVVKVGKDHGGVLCGKKPLDAKCGQDTHELLRIRVHEGDKVPCAGSLHGEDEFVFEKALFAAVAGSRLQMIQRCIYIEEKSVG